MRHITKKIASIGIPAAGAIATYALTKDGGAAAKAGLATCFSHHALNWAATMITDYDYYRPIRDTGAERLWNLPAKTLQKIELCDRLILGLTAAVGLGLTTYFSNLENTKAPAIERPACCTAQPLERAPLE